MDTHTESNPRPEKDLDVSKFVHNWDRLREVAKSAGQVEDEDDRRQIDYLQEIMLYGAFTSRAIRRTSMRLPAPPNIVDVLRKFDLFPPADSTTLPSEDDEIWRKIKKEYDATRSGAGMAGRSR